LLRQGQVIFFLKMDKPERVMIFIDGSNLYFILKNLYKNSKEMSSFKFEKFARHLAGNGKLIRTYYYNAILDQQRDKGKYSKQQRFFEALKLIPDFEVIVCRMQKDHDSDGNIRYSVKGDDIHIAVDMVKLAYNDAYDKAILVSSDGDFVPAIEAVKEKGKKVENIGFKNKFSWHLKQTCDRFTLLRKEDTDKFF